MTHPLILLWFMVLGAIMMFLIWWKAHDRYLQLTTQENMNILQSKRAIGQSVRLEWEIGKVYGFGMLQFRSNDGHGFIIKSTTTNINQLTGTVTIQWTVSEYNWVVPVVNVSQYQSDSLPNGPQFWYDARNGVVFRPWYDVKIISSGDLITIIDPVVNKEVVRIRSFACSGTGMMDECGIEWSDKYPSFISSYRHVFIRWDNVWYAFWDGKWYRIWASDEYYVNSMSQYFDLMNTRVMSDLVRKELKTKCVWPMTDVVEYVSHRTREQNGNTFVIIRGLSSTKKMAVCQLKIITEKNSISFESITTIPVEE